MKRVFLSMLVVGMLTGCAKEAPPAPPLPAAGLPNAYDAILRIVPVGTPVAKATLALERQGFRCEADGSHIYGELTQPLRPNISRQWHVVVSHDGTQVTDVTVSSVLAAEPQIREGSHLPGR